MTHPTNISSCIAADLDSCASRTNRLSKNSTTALIRPSALSSKPEWPAGLRDGKLPLLISGAFELTSEDQTQHESNSEGSEYRFVGFSRTYCSASSWNVRTRLLASPQACSALPRASPQACSAFPRYSSAKAPAADFKSSAALRACSLLLCNLFCASALAGVVGSPGLFCSAIGGLQLICSVRLSARFLKWANADLSQIINASHASGGLLCLMNALTLKRLTSSASEETENYCSRKMIRAFVRSYGESSTETLSPGTILMKCLRILPEI